MASVLDHERSKITDDQGHRTSNVVNLKNPKNHKVNNNHSFNDILDGDLPLEPEIEPVPIEPTKKPFKENDFFENFEKPEMLDKKAGTPNNLGDMAPLTTFAWTAFDRNHELISHAWRKGIILILVAMAFAALLRQGSILTAITFFALALVTSMHFWQEAKEEKYEIHAHGVAIGDRFYHYHDLDSFWIHFHPEGHHELSLCTGRLLNHYVKVSLKGQDPLEVRDALMRYLPEERHEEGLEDLLRRKLGL